jgi:hypothetical protein
MLVKGLVSLDASAHRGSRAQVTRAYSDSSTVTCAESYQPGISRVREQRAAFYYASICRLGQGMHLLFATGVDTLSVF